MLAGGGFVQFRARLRRGEETAAGLGFLFDEFAVARVLVGDGFGRPTGHGPTLSLRGGNANARFAGVRLVMTAARVHDARRVDLLSLPKRLFRQLVPPARQRVTWGAVAPLAGFLVVFAAVCLVVEMRGVLRFTYRPAFALMVLTPWLWWLHHLSYFYQPKLCCIQMLLPFFLLPAEQYYYCR